MSRTAWLNALLACAVAGLGLFVYFRPGTGTKDYALATLDRAAARVVRIERPGAPPVVLEKRQNDWFLSAPLAARADAGRVDRILAIAAARSAHRLAADDLARFELDRPAARLTIDGQSLDFGLVNTVSREQYVLAGGAVYAVDVRLVTALPAAAGDLIDKRLFGPAETPIRVELKDFGVAKEDGRWTLRPQQDELSQDDLARWLDGWRHAQALRVEPHVGSKPLGEVRVGLSDGRTVTLGIVARAAEVALLRSDEKLVYYFFKDAGQRLLAPPGAVIGEKK
jgi:hypothetical protein